ncbi:MAG: hypothetical protein TREMPRED_005020 [Tremellales sp. Tagirdzhanova-0007]|nr:MAG: hypothetical protein TREMPRED_005020 [Tremellales sp. Tagirdzhanova-0007]
MTVPSSFRIGQPQVTQSCALGLAYQQDDFSSFIASSSTEITSETKLSHLFRSSVPGYSTGWRPFKYSVTIFEIAENGEVVALPTEEVISGHIQEQAFAEGGMKAAYKLVTNFNAAISSSFAANTLRKAPVFSHAPCYLMSEAFDNPDSATRIGMSWMVEPLLSQDGWTEEKILDWQGYTVPLAPTPLQKDVHAFLHFAYDLSSHTGVHNCVVPGDVQDVCVKLSLSNLQAEKILPPTDDVPPWTEQMVIEQKEEEAEAECDV